MIISMYRYEVDIIKMLLPNSHKELSTLHSMNIPLVVVYYHFTGSCEHSNKYSGSIKARESLD